MIFDRRSPIGVSSVGVEGVMTSVGISRGCERATFDMVVLKSGLQSGWASCYLVFFESEYSGEKRLSRQSFAQRCSMCDLKGM